MTSVQDNVTKPHADVRAEAVEIIDIDEYQSTSIPKETILPKLKKRRIGGDDTSKAVRSDKLEAYMRAKPTECNVLKNLEALKTLEASNAPESVDAPEAALEPLKVPEATQAPQVHKASKKTVVPTLAEKKVKLQTRLAWHVSHAQRIRDRLAQLTQNSEHHNNTRDESTHPKETSQRPQRRPLVAQETIGLGHDEDDRIDDSIRYVIVVDDCDDQEEDDETMVAEFTSPPEPKNTFSNYTRQGAIRIGADNRYYIESDNDKTLPINPATPTSHTLITVDEGDGAAPVVKREDALRFASKRVPRSFSQYKEFALTGVMMRGRANWDERSGKDYVLQFYESGREKWMRKGMLYERGHPNHRADDHLG